MKQTYKHHTGQVFNLVHEIATAMASSARGTMTAAGGAGGLSPRRSPVQQSRRKQQQQRQQQEFRLGILAKLSTDMTDWTCTEELKNKVCKEIDRDLDLRNQVHETRIFCASKTEVGELDNLRLWVRTVRPTVLVQHDDDADSEMVPRA